MIRIPLACVTRLLSRFHVHVLDVGVRVLDPQRVDETCRRIGPGRSPLTSMIASDSSEVASTVEGKMRMP
jgi:hypothetical protein